MKRAEFVLLRETAGVHRVLAVEAKTRCPGKNETPFDEFGKEIAAQLCNALAIYFSVRLNRLADPLRECPAGLMAVDLG